MAIKKTPHVRLGHLGRIYQLIEQSKGITRAELAQKTQLAAPTITCAVKDLLQRRMIMEQFAPDPNNRGRKIASLCVSPFYWQLLCANLTEERFELCCSRLDGEVVYYQKYEITQQDISKLELFLHDRLVAFLSKLEMTTPNLVFSLVVKGRLDNEKILVQLGKYKDLDIDLAQLFSPHFHAPILLSDYFYQWVKNETQVNPINVASPGLFLQLDDIAQTQLTSSNEQVIPSDINGLFAPRLHSWQDKIYTNLPEYQRYRLDHQLINSALCQYVDWLYPEMVARSKREKIDFLCCKMTQQDPSAVQILEIYADCLSYLLQNLHELFVIHRVILNTPLLKVEHFLPLLNQKLEEKAKRKNTQIEVIAGQFFEESIKIAQTSIKRAIYLGKLVEDFGIYENFSEI